MGDKKPSKFFNLIKKHKIIFLICVFILLLIIIVAGAKIWLYLKLFLGNDVIIKLETDREYISTHRNIDENINFKASVITNLFCEAQCTEKFEDISSNTIIDTQQLTLKRSSPIEKTYTINIKDLGEGQKIYRMTLACQSHKSFLCNTEEEATVRNILVTIDYELSEEESALRLKLKNELDELKNGIAKISTRTSYLDNRTNEINNFIAIDSMVSKIDSLKTDNILLNEEVGNLLIIWDSMRYYYLNSETIPVIEEFNQSSNKIIDVEENMNSTIDYYNYLLQQISSQRNMLQSIQGETFINSTIVDEINSVISSFNEDINIFSQRNSLEVKENLISNSFQTVKSLKNKTDLHLRTETMKRYLEADIDYALLCNLTDICVDRPTIQERSIQQNLKLIDSCADIETLRDLYNKVNDSLNQTQILNYSESEWANAVKALEYKEQLIKEDMIKNLPPDYENSNIITVLLKFEPVDEVPAPKDAITYLIISKNNSCNLDEKTFFIQSISTKSFQPLTKNIIIINQELFSTPIPNKKCCVFGECKDCCDSETCADSEELYPIIFLHGHSFNQGLDADYSLDAFNGMQIKLENEGYLSAGSMTLYTPIPDKKNIWDQFIIPVSIKESYYFDTFQDPDNYVLVQTKSESIETYALRLRELVQATKERTGRNKVNIVAHSMGGLVARKYIQLFGSDDVNKLIMIGTPNKGIRGNVVNFCSIIGANLECRDMTADSLFLNKLNRQQMPDINIYNIVGSGCDMKGQDGDGIVLKEDAYINSDAVNNIVIEGQCKGLRILHTEMLKVSKYPEVYEAVLNALEE